jgi:hypothetical protein
MSRKEDARQLKFENFYLLFGGNLRSDNRWIILAGIIFLLLFVVQDMRINGLRDCLRRPRWMPNSLPAAA